MGDTHGRGWSKHRAAEHTHEHLPPHQKKFVDDGDDNWRLKATALPVTDPKVSSEPGDSIASNLMNADNVMSPCYNDNCSPYIHQSHTNGKKG